MIKQGLIAASLALSALSALATPPGADEVVACQRGQSHGRTTVTPIPFQVLNEEDDYWRGYAATTVIFKGHAIGYARKGDAEGVAFNRRVYPLDQATPINMPREQFKELVQRGRVSMAQASDWYWLRGPRPFVCVVTNRSMEKASPILIFLSTGKAKRVYVVESQPSEAAAPTQ